MRLSLRRNQRRQPTGSLTSHKTRAVISLLIMKMVTGDMLLSSFGEGEGLGELMEFYEAENNDNENGKDVRGKRNRI